ncbi:MAG: hypothetical protein PHE21_00250 [Candidatus Dojkabacteria bacterium]|nr:hypothetical protein [Candidatus Dojkabacteria bacterium]
MDGKISELATESIQTSPQMLTDYKLDKVVELHIDNVDSQKVIEIKDMLTSEVLLENRKHAHGINVLGEGSVGYDYIAPLTETKFLEDPKQILAKYSEELQVKEKDIQEMSEDDAARRIREEVEKRNSQSSQKRRAETKLLQELGVDGSIKIHMCKGPFDARYLDTSSSDPKQEEAFTYVRNQIEKEIRVQIALGPGFTEYTNENGEIVTNTTTYIDPETKALGKSETVFHIPSKTGELEKWDKYCRYVSSRCSGAEFDIWIEPNHNLDDNGHGKFEHNTDSGRHGEFSSEGRKPEEYALAVIVASNAIKQEAPDSKVGINVAFVDIEYIEKTIETIKILGYDPTKIIDYVSFNPYRFGKKPEMCGPKWNENLEGFRGDSAPKGRFDWNTEGSYEEEVLALMGRVSSLGIRDIRTSESGYPVGELTRQQQAEYNLRGWVLDRYLGLPESPWTLTSESEDFSFIDKEGNKTETFYAYKNFNSIFSSSIIPSGEIHTKDEKVMCKVFEDESNGSQILVVWSPTGYYSNKGENNRPVKISVPLLGEKSVEIITGLSKDTPNIEKRATNKLEINVHGEPVIIRISKGSN